MISVKEALDIVKNNTQPTNKSEIIPVIEALGYVLFEDVLSPINMPPFRQSAMDGYAINIHHGKEYHLIDEVKAGDSHHPILKAGEAVRIFTGAPVPDTANSVIIQENVSVNGTKIRYEKETKLENNIRPLGEQTKQGAIALKKGTKLTAAAIGYLTTLGIVKITVNKKPSIAIVVTGNELIKAGNKLEYGKIYESNASMLKSAVVSLGYTNIKLHKVSDNYKATKNQLEKVIAENDLVLISGGISVGDYDFVGKALQELKVKQHFYKVKQKPGKPLFYGKKENVQIFALPGNPASALSCFYIYVHLALEKIAGNTNFSHTIIKAESETDFIKMGKRAQFLKAILKDNKVQILEGQSSAMLQTFALANASVFLAEETMSVKKGDDVTVYKLPIY